MGAAAQRQEARKDPEAPGGLTGTEPASELVTGDSGQHPLQYAATRGLVASHCRTGMPPCPYAAGTLAARCWNYGLMKGRRRALALSRPIPDGEQRESASPSGEGGVSRETPPSSVPTNEHARRPWWPDDDVKLLRLVDAGFSQPAIAEILERTPKAIERRYARLNSNEWVAP